MTGRNHGRIILRPHIYINAKAFKYNNGLAAVVGRVCVVQPGKKRYIFWDYDTTSTVCHDFINVSPQLRRLL